MAFSSSRLHRYHVLIVLSDRMVIEIAETLLCVSSFQQECQIPAKYNDDSLSHSDAESVTVS